MFIVNQALPLFLWLTVFLWGVLPFLTLFNRRWAPSVLMGVIIGLGGIILLAASVTGLTDASNINIALPLFAGSLPIKFELAPAGCWFLTVLALVTLALSFYTPSYLSHIAKETDLRFFWPLTGWLLISMAGVVISANVFTFIITWELMSITSFLLAATNHKARATRYAALVYLGTTRVAAGLVMAAFLLAYRHTGSLTFADWHILGHDALVPGVLLLLAFGIKAGMWPFHFWLPLAHPAAPAPISAIMSGLMVKVPAIMIVRFFILPPMFSHPLFGIIILGLAAITAFWGVAFALLQHDMKRLLAYHTVENIGLILLGLGLAIKANDFQLPGLAKMALAAALFHIANHAFFKSLLFFGAGSVAAQAGTAHLDELGGLGKLMPGTFLTFVLGSAAICALPPLNGFASEWLLYQSFFSLAVHGPQIFVRFLSVCFIAWLALIGALALACFTKAVGVVFLGRPRSAAAAKANEVSRPMLAAKGILAALCALYGLFPQEILLVLNKIVSPLDPSGLSPAIIWPYSMAGIFVIIAAVSLIWFIWRRQVSINKPPLISRTWECGFGDLAPRMQVNPTSFAKPVARLFSALFRTAIHLRIDGVNRRLFPEEITSELKVHPFLESNIYLPILRAADRFSKWLTRLQAGSIHLYLLTMLATVLVLIFLARFLP